MSANVEWMFSGKKEDDMIIWKDHPTGRYIVTVAHHVVAVVDGKYYDTWDSGEKSLYGYYEKRGE